MTRAPRSRRMILVAAVAVLGLAACGEADTTDSGPAGTSRGSAPGTDAVDVTTPGKDGPAVIVLGDQAESGRAATAPMADQEDGAATASVAGDTMMRIGNIEYRFEGTVPELPSTGAAWYFPADRRATAEQAAALAEALGVQGEVRELPEDQGGGFMVGPADYTGPTLTVGTDAMQSWWYGSNTVHPSVGTCEDVVHIDGAETKVGSGTGTAAETQPADAPDAPDAAPANDVETDPMPACEPARPPEGVPSAEEAEVAARELFARLGLDLASYEIETYADEWSAGVTAYLLVDGIRTQVSHHVGFGAGGEISWAGGSLGTPVRGDDYPLIGVQAGIDRLNEQAERWAAGPVDPAVLDDGADGETVGGDAVVSVEVAPEPRPAVDADAPVTTMIAPVPGEPPAAAETLVVTFTGVRPSLEQVWAADGTIWLLPGYQFEADDEGWYTVIAVEDEYLHQPEPAVDPAVPAPGGGSGEPGAPAACATPPAVEPIDTSALTPDAVTFLVGTCVDDAAAAAEPLGISVRVVRQDGEDLASTDDYVTSRVNVAVEGGVITEIVSIG